MPGNEHIIQELRQTIGHMEALLQRLESSPPVVTPQQPAFRTEEDTSTEQNRIEALQELFGDVSHDLRTPLSNIRTSVFLLRNVSDENKRKHYLDILDIQAKHLEQVILDLMSMSRLDADVTEFEFQRVAVNRMLLDILESLSAMLIQKNHQVNTDFGTNLPLLTADRVKISRAITNVVVNAIQYTPDNGTIFLRTYTQNNYMVIEVHDNGVGIPPELLPHIFKRFYRGDEARRTVQGGAGLGLSIAKKIVERHQGYIEVESNVGAGSMFRVCFLMLGAQ